jgi:hypothetical protein
MENNKHHYCNGLSPQWLPDRPGYEGSAHESPNRGAKFSEWCRAAAAVRFDGGRWWSGLGPTARASQHWGEPILVHGADRESPTGMIHSGAVRPKRNRGGGSEECSPVVVVGSWTLWTTFSIGPTSNSHFILGYKFWNRFKFEYSLNFKGVQTLWEKSRKISKILCWLNLRNCEFNWAHLHARICSSYTSVKRHGLNLRKGVWIWNSNHTTLIIQTKLAITW